MEGGGESDATESHVSTHHMSTTVREAARRSSVRRKSVLSGVAYGAGPGGTISSPPHPPEAGHNDETAGTAQYAMDKLSSNVERSQTPTHAAPAPRRRANSSMAARYAVATATVVRESDNNTRNDADDSAANDVHSSSIAVAAPAARRASAMVAGRRSFIGSAAHGAAVGPLVSRLQRRARAQSRAQLATGRKRAYTGIQEGNVQAQLCRFNKQIDERQQLKAEQLRLREARMRKRHTSGLGARIVRLPQPGGKTVDGRDGSDFNANRAAAIAAENEGIAFSLARSSDEMTAAAVATMEAMAGTSDEAYEIEDKSIEAGGLKLRLRELVAKLRSMKVSLLPEPAMETSYSAVGELESIADALNTMGMVSLRAVATNIAARLRTAEADGAANAGDAGQGGNNAYASAWWDMDSQWQLATELAPLVPVLGSADDIEEVVAENTGEGGAGAAGFIDASNIYFFNVRTGETSYSREELLQPIDSIEEIELEALDPAQLQTVLSTEQSATVLPGSYAYVEEHWDANTNHVYFYNTLTGATSYYRHEVAAAPTEGGVSVVDCGVRDTQYAVLATSSEMHQAAVHVHGTNDASEAVEMLTELPEESEFDTQIEVDSIVEEIDGTICNVEELQISQVDEGDLRGGHIAGFVQTGGGGAHSSAQVAHSVRASVRPSQTPVVLRARAASLALRMQELHDVHNYVTQLASRLQAKRCSLKIAVNSLEDLRSCLEYVRMEEVGQRVRALSESISAEGVEQLWISPQRGMQNAVATELVEVAGIIETAMSEVRLEQIKTRELSHSLWEMDLPKDEVLLSNKHNGTGAFGIQHAESKGGSTLGGSDGSLPAQTSAGVLRRSSASDALSRKYSSRRSLQKVAALAAVPEQQQLAAPDYEAQVKAMSLKEMKAMLDRQYIDYSQCIEKFEIRALVKLALEKKANESPATPGDHTPSDVTSMKTGHTLRTESGASVDVMLAHEGLSGLRMSIDSWSGPVHRRRIVEQAASTAADSSATINADTDNIIADDGKFTPSHHRGDTFAEFEKLETRSRSSSKGFDFKGMAKNMLKWRQKGRPSQSQMKDTSLEDPVNEADTSSKRAVQPKKRWFERRATRNKDIEAAQAQRRRSTSLPDPRAKGGLLKYVEAKQAEVQHSDSRLFTTNSSAATVAGGESVGSAHARNLEFYTGGGASARSLRGPTRGAGGRNSRIPEDALDSDMRRKRNAKRLVRQTSSKGVNRGRGKATERTRKERSTVRGQPKPSQTFGASSAEGDRDQLRVTHTLRKQCERILHRVNFDQRPAHVMHTSRAAAIACIQAVIRGFLARKAHASALQHEFENYMEKIHEEGLRLIVYQKKRKGKISAEERGDIGTPIAELVTVEHIKGQLNLTRLDQGRGERSARVGGKAQRLRDVHRIIVGVQLPDLWPH
eukprot:g1722.t1